MEWQNLANFTLTGNWRLSQFTTGLLFKLKHTINDYSNKDAIAVIALINDTINPIEIFEPRRIIPKPEAEIIQFSSLQGWNYKFAIKQVQLPGKQLINWSIHVSTIPQFITLPVSNLNLHAKFDDSKKTLLIATM